MADEGWMTAAEMAKEIGTTEYSANKAILSLGLGSKGKRDMADRRRMVYPPGTLDQVRKWLESN